MQKRFAFGQDVKLRIGGGGGGVGGGCWWGMGFLDRLRVKKQNS